MEYEEVLGLKMYLSREIDKYRARIYPIVDYNPERFCKPFFVDRIESSIWMNNHILEVRAIIEQTNISPEQRKLITLFQCLTFYCTSGNSRIPRSDKHGYGLTKVNLSTKLDIIRAAYIHYWIRDYFKCVFRFNPDKGVYWVVFASMSHATRDVKAFIKRRERLAEEYLPYQDSLSNSRPSVFTFLHNEFF